MYDLNKLPEDFKLRHIGGVYGTVRSAEIGETIKFNYKSGSNPGIRTVLIVRRDNEGFSGICLERDCEWRRFLYSRCVGGHESIKPFIKIEKKEVVKTERKVSVVPQVQEPTVVGLKHGGKGGKAVLTFTNKHGKIFTVETFDDGSVGYRNGNKPFESITFRLPAFADELKNFLS